ncbi:MAG: fluoride efflux transporter CrcB [Magnetococcus sp. WYHC-3]
MTAILANMAAVALGGALGAVARYLVTGWVGAWLGRSFPWGTLTVNVTGSLLMGMLFHLLVERWGPAPLWRMLLMVGVLGAFTTFSSFALETLQLLETGLTSSAALNILASVILCLLAVWAGVVLARLL